MRATSAPQGMYLTVGNFAFLQLLALVRIELRRGFTLGTFSYKMCIRDRGNKVIEIKSPEFTKGSEVNRLLLATRYDFILEIGDDTTDADVYKRQVLQ